MSYCSAQQSESTQLLVSRVTGDPEAGTPPLAAASWRLGQVLEKEGRKDEARAELQAAVKLDPNLKEAQQDLKRLK